MFTVALTYPTAFDVFVDFVTASGTATSDIDFVSSAGTIGIPAGDLSTQVHIFVFGDTDIEDDETFFVNLSNPFIAEILDGQGIGTIQNDDGVVPVERTTWGAIKALYRQ